jgi:alginate O-acetyltransferase complex protein AlgI
LKCLNAPAPTVSQKMLFYEPSFVTFFGALYALYLATGRALTRKWILLLASVLFYVWGEPAFVLILLTSSLIDYVLAFYLAEPIPRNHRSLALSIGLATNLGILATYKYADFVAANLNAMLSPFGSQLIPMLHLALPIGVSFVVFEKITYLVDTWRGVSRRANHFSDYALFVFFFPKLLAGPILKFHEVQEQIVKPAQIEWTDCAEGLLRFARGIGRKLLIAEPLGGYVGKVFDHDPAGLGAGQAWLALVCFTVQIYFDFAGYSDMAIGLARMMGFRLNENFNAPYISRSITEFWRRWHISLTTWIRDYLYVPLGGNKTGKARTYLNLWICFLVSGLWHGASWNFVLWGAYNGLFLTLDRIFLQRLLDRSGAAISRAVTLFIVMIGWAIFRAEKPGMLTSFLGSLLGGGSGLTEIESPPDVPLALLFGVIISLFPAFRFYGWLGHYHDRNAWMRIGTRILLTLIYVIALARAFGMPFQPFIYFRF